MTTPTPADHHAAKRLTAVAAPLYPWQLEHIAVAIAEARAEGYAAALEPFADLFSGGPDTPCRTTYRDERVGEGLAVAVECVEVPMGELRGAFDEAERIAEGRA